MPELELGIGLWEGTYKGVSRLWLRFYDANEHWILTDAEQLALEKELAEQRAEYLAKRLRELGIEP